MPIRHEIRHCQQSRCAALGDNRPSKIFLIERKQVGITEEIGLSRQIWMHQFTEFPYRDVVKVGRLSRKAHGMFCCQRDVLADLILGGRPEPWQGSDELAEVGWTLRKGPGASFSKHRI